MQNERTVYVAHVNERKDLKAAEHFGRLLDVFSGVGRNYNTPRMIEHARRVLSNWQPGDSILMIGDPALCGICIAVASEFDDVITTLSWDRNEFVYIPRRWDLSPEARGVDSAAYAA
jgi:hypothetical protein